MPLGRPLGFGLGGIPLRSCREAMRVEADGKDAAVDTLLPPESRRHRPSKSGRAAWLQFIWSDPN
jgi:hypothetical protein